MALKKLGWPLVGHRRNVTSVSTSTETISLLYLGVLIKSVTQLRAVCP